VRVSEKTIELNFCSQLGALLGQPQWWFGLTQKQEADAGWDVAGKMGGRWLLFQLKASSHILSNGQRQFRCQHQQLESLRDRATMPLKVFYVLPSIGTTAELGAAGFDLVPNIHLVDVFDIVGVGPPTTRSGSLRKSEAHYFDLDSAAHTVTIHSDPVTVETVSLASLADRVSTDRSRFEDGTNAGGDAREFMAQGRGRVAAFLPVL
jgi:hypothetical protein